MNAVASTPASDPGILAMLAASLSGAPPTPPVDSAAFLNVVHLLLTPLGGVDAANTADTGVFDPRQEGIVAATPPSTSPLQLADALIRSMLNGGSPGSALPADDLPQSAASGEEVSGAPSDSVSADGTSARKKAQRPQDAASSNPASSNPALSNAMLPINLNVALLPQAPAVPVVDSPGTTGTAAGTDGDRSIRFRDKSDASPTQVGPQNAGPGSIAFQAHLIEKQSGGSADAGNQTPGDANADFPAQGKRESSPAGGDPSGNRADTGDDRRQRGSDGSGRAEFPSQDAAAAVTPMHAGESMAMPAVQHSGITTASGAHSAGGNEHTDARPSSLQVADTPASAPASPSAREIVVRVARPEAPPVDVQIRQRAADIQVTVRTPDAPLQQSLRSDLPELVSSLDRAGYEAQVFPGGSGDAKAVIAYVGSTEARGDSPNQQNGRGDANHPGSSAGQQHESQQDDARQQNQRGRLIQSWLDQMEK